MNNKPGKRGNMFFRITVLSLVLIASVTGASASDENPMLVRVDFVGETDINRLATFNLDIPVVTGTHADVVAYRSDLKKLDSASLNYRIVHEDLVRFYQSRNPMNLDMGGYPTYQEVIDSMDALHANYPLIVSQRWSIGAGWNGNEQWVFKISDNVEFDEDEPEVFYNSLTHAREPAGMTWILNFAAWLCQNYGSDPVAADIVDNRELFFLPIVNPDGYEYNRMTYPGGGGMWRKNRRNNGDGTYGVDLNRNWGYMWGYDNNGSSPNTFDETYRGLSAFSEPETQAVREFIDSRNFSFVLSAHTYGGLLLYPWGYDDIFTPDQDFFSAIGDSATTLIGYPNGTPWQLLYNTNGDSNDWTYGEQLEKPLIFCLSPETGDDFDGFWPAPSRIPQLNAQMLPLGIYVAQLGGNLMGLDFDYPGGIPETTTPGQPTSFEVVITGVRGGVLVSGSGQLHYSIDGEPYVPVDMEEGESGHYTALLPALDCGSTIAFYFTAEEQSAGIFSDPPGAPADDYSAFPMTGLIVAFEDNFEGDMGWSVVDSGGLTAGSWDRGIPAGGGDRGDPPTDYDGSGQCYLTDNVYGNSDVDDGFTFLISPTFDLSGQQALVEYALWYTNNFGNDPNNDLFKVYVSDNGGLTWTLAETIGPVTQGGWTEHSFRINDFVTPTGQVKVRFEASDTGAGSVVEAGVDAFSVSIIQCETTDIPTVSQWGMIFLGFLLLVAGTLATITRRRYATISA